MRGQQECAMRVIDDLRTERIEHLERVRQGLETDERSEYWELIDRGANFSYMPPNSAVLDPAIRCSAHQSGPPLR